MVVHQNITNLAGYFHFLNVRKIPYVILRPLDVSEKHHSAIRRHNCKLMPMRQ